MQDYFIVLTTGLFYIYILGMIFIILPYAAYLDWRKKKE